MNSELWNKLYPNFKKSEFKCDCGCCSEPPMNWKLMCILQAIRNKYGTVNVKSGYRCKKYNSSLSNSSSNSDHMFYRAADIQFNGCEDLEKRKEIMNYAKHFVGFKYAYCNGGILYANGTAKAYSAPLMGRSVHISVED